MKAQTLFSLSFIGLAVAMPQQQPSNGAIKFPNANDDECDRGKAMAGPRGTICIGAKGEIFGPPGKTKSKVDGQARPDGQVVKGNTGSCPDYLCLRRANCTFERADGCVVCKRECRARG